MVNFSSLIALDSPASLCHVFDCQASSFAEVTIQSAEAVGEGIADLLFGLGTDGLIEENEGPFLTLRCYFPRDDSLPLKLSIIRSYLQSLKAMGLEVGQALVEARLWEDPGWTTKWKEHFRPIRVGRHLVVKPSWQSYPAREGDLIIEIDPGMAFGTGAHPTTKMCLELLEEAMEHMSGIVSCGRGASSFTVLDLGTGSGILAIAAAKLGAGKVLALDVDPQACLTARQNARLNGVEDYILVEEGSLKEGMGPFALILANLSAKDLVSVLPSLKSGVLPSGWLILSGLLAEQSASFLQLLVAEGLRIVRERIEESWLTFLVAPR